MANFKYSKDINTLSRLSHGHLPSLNKIADRTSENKMMTNIPNENSACNWEAIGEESY